MAQALGVRGLGVGGGSAPWWMVAGVLPWAVYQPKGAASFAASLVDLTGQGHDAGDPGGANTPDWDATNGWKFTTANSDYLTTTFIPSNDQTQSVSVQFSNCTLNNAGYLVGSVDTTGGADYFTLMPRQIADFRVYGNGSVNTQKATRLTSGNMAVAGADAYYNGADEGLALAAWNAACDVAMYIGCRNVDGAPDQYLDGYIQAVVIYDVSLTAGQVAVVAAVMAGI